MSYYLRRHFSRSDKVPKTSHRTALGRYFTQNICFSASVTFPGISQNIFIPETLFSKCLHFGTWLYRKLYLKLLQVGNLKIHLCWTRPKLQSQFFSPSVFVYLNLQQPLALLNRANLALWCSEQYKLHLLGPTKCCLIPASSEECIAQHTCSRELCQKLMYCVFGEFHNVQL